MAKHFALILLLLGVIISCAVGQSLLTITHVNGDQPQTTPDGLKLEIPVGSELTLVWDLIDDDIELLDDSQYFAMVTYAHDSPLYFPYSVPVYSLTTNVTTFTIPITAPRTNTVLNLIIYTTMGSNNDVKEMLTLSTEPFQTISLCQVNPTMCGTETFNTCDSITSKCTCRRGWSGTNCEIAPCPLGFTGPTCEIAIPCQTHAQCSNGGFLGHYTDKDTGIVVCDTVCSCPNPMWETPIDAEPFTGCNQCTIENGKCDNGGVFHKKNCACNCQPGTMGSDCSRYYALGKLSILNLEFTRVPIATFFANTLKTYVATLMTIPTNDVNIFATFNTTMSNTTTGVIIPQWNIVLQFPYDILNDRSAPQLSIIHEGWLQIVEMFQNDGATVFDALLTILGESPSASVEDDIDINIIEVQQQQNDEIINKNENEQDNINKDNNNQIQLQSLMTFLSEADPTFLQPSALYDPSCHKTKGTVTTCPTGIWPGPGREPFDRSNKEKTQWWVIILAATLIGSAIIALIGFFVWGGGDKWMTEDVVAAATKARLTRKTERFKRMAERDAERAEYVRDMKNVCNDKIANDEQVICARIGRQPRSASIAMVTLPPPATVDDTTGRVMVVTNNESNNSSINNSNNNKNGNNNNNNNTTTTTTTTNEQHWQKVEISANGGVEMISLKTINKQPANMTMLNIESSSSSDDVDGDNYNDNDDAQDNDNTASESDASNVGNLIHCQSIIEPHGERLRYSNNASSGHRSNGNTPKSRDCSPAPFPRRTPRNADAH